MTRPLTCFNDVANEFKVLNMPMHDWSRVQSGVYHSFRYLWIAAIIDRLNAGLLPSGMIAMAEQIISGPEPDVVTLQQNDIAFSADGGADAIMTEAPPQPKTQFVISMDVERYAAKANRVVVRHSLGKVAAVVELVSPGKFCNLADGSVRTRTSLFR